MRLFTLIAAFWCCPNLFAADTPFVRSVRDYSGGINSLTAPIVLPDNQQTVAFNFVPDTTPGAYSTRPGSVLWGTWPTSSSILDAFAYEKSSSNRFVVGSDGTSLRYTRNGSAWTTMVSGLPTNSRFNFAIVNGNLWAVSSRSYPIAFDGATVYTLNNSATTSNPPKNSKIITYWQSRVWLANTPALPSVIYFSSLVDDNGNYLDPLKDDAFDPLNQIYVNREDGTSVNALVPYRGFLFVFKDNSIWRINFISEQNLSLDRIVDNIGVTAGNSIKEWNGLLTFLSTDGNIYSFNGESCQLIGLPILPQTKNAVPGISSAESGEGIMSYTSGSDYAKGTIVPLFSNEDNAIAMNSSSSTLMESFSSSTFTTTPNIVPFPTTYKTVIEDASSACGQSAYIQSRQGHVVITSTASTANTGGCGFFELSTTTHHTFGTHTWAGEFMSIGLPQTVSDMTIPDATSSFNFYVSTRTDNFTGQPGNERIGFAMRSNGYDQRLCIVMRQRMCTAAIGCSPAVAKDYDLEYCKYLSDLSPVCLSNAVSYPDLGSYKYTFAGNFLAEITPGRKVTVQATNSTYSQCNFTLTADVPADFYLSSTSYHSGYVRGMRNYPGNPQHLVFGNFYTPAAPSTGSWTSDAIYAPQNIQWGEINFNQSISTDTLNYGSDIIQGTTVSYRTSATSTFTDAFTVIAAGAQISSAAANYIQIKLEGTTPLIKTDSNGFSLDNRAKLTDIFVNWQWSAAGSPAYAQPAALVNDNKYYLALSTNGVLTANNTIARLSSIPSTNWTLHNLAASSLFTFQTQPYAAISNKIYRIEASTITTDNGTAIDYGFETKDYIEGAPYYPKYIQYVLADFERSESTATVGVSINGGTTWSDKTIYLNDGAGTRSTKRLNITVGPTSSYRLRVKRSAGVPITLYGLDVVGYTSDAFSEGK